MEDKDKNVDPKPGKSIWKKSNFKQETGEKCKKNLRFNLIVDVKNDDNHNSSFKDGKSSRSEPSPKKRKNDMDMPNVPNEVEREIELQYYSKATESKLTARNVKTILKSVITNKYVVDMVRAAEEGGQSVLPFEPKLTRAKTKELLQQHPEIPVPPVMGLLTNAPSTAEMSPEVKILIDKELSEDSSDEEYNPENEPEPIPSEDEEKGDVSVASDMDSLPPTPASQAPPTPVHDSSYDWSQDGIFKLPQENVGQRTRSKLDFHNLPLECIEQALIPPDITPDMYEAECDNPDWHDFLKEFTQPLAVNNETLDDDPENDPEYNILEDEEKDPVDYKEEMRKDRAVKVSKKELNCLMKELFEVDALSSDDDDARTSESIAELEASIMKETEERERREQEEKKKKQVGFHPNQRLLLAQQLRQHVQLTTQHFLQTYRHPKYHRHAATCKTMLMTLSGLKNDNICCRETHNLAAALDTVVRWESIHNQAGDRIKQFVADQIKAEGTLKRNKRKVVQQFPPEMMRCMMESEAFLYPLLLPPTPFLTSHKATGPNFFTPSEDMLLAISLEQVTQLMEENKKIFKKKTLADICRVIVQTSIPRSTPTKIAAHIRKLKGREMMNPVKAFYENGKPPVVCHYVVPVSKGKQLYQQPVQLLPEVWRSFLAVAYEKKEDDGEAKPGTSCVTQKQLTSVLREKKSEVPKQLKKDGDSNKEVKTEKDNLERAINKGAEKESKGLSDYKKLAKTEKRIIINNVIQNASSTSTKSVNLCEKPKTTMKDIISMMARKNSIQKAVQFNGKINLNNDQLLINKTENATKASKKTSAKTLNATGSKVEGKQSTHAKSRVKSGIRSSNLHSKEQNGTNKTNSVLPKKSLKSKLKMSKKKKVKDADPKRVDDRFIETVVPKIKFRVISQSSGSSVKLKNKEKNIISIVSKGQVESINQQQYLDNFGLSPTKQSVKVVDCQDHGFDLPSFASNMAQPNSNYLGSRLLSESDSHQSNSIESSRTPLCVNITKSCGSKESHSLRPPSTVKLKERFNSDSMFSLYNDKTKVPSTVYSLLNGSS